MMIKYYVANLIILIFILITSCFEERPWDWGSDQRGMVVREPLERVQFLMGTYARVVISGGTNKDIDAAFSKIKDLDSLLSDYNPGSQISQINRLAGKRGVEVKGEVKEVLQIALKVAEETKGAFDPTIGALTTSLYHFGRENARVPTDEEINKSKGLVNYKLLSIDGNSVFLKREGMMIDLGGIGKGFAVDKAVEVLKKRGIRKGMVSLSGDIRVFGEDFEVGIKHPREDGTVASFRTGGRDLAISTSGDYERYVEENGKVYHHLLVPKTGKSGRDFQSITVIMEGSNTLADAYATSLFVMGREKAFEFLKDHPEVGVFIVFSDGDVFFNEGFKRLAGFNRGL